MMWRDKAECFGAEPDLFAQDDNRNKEIRELDESTIWRYCKRCPVIQECLDEALLPVDQGGSPYGIRGGMTADERRRLRRGPRSPVAGSKVRNPTNDAHRTSLYEAGMSDAQIGAFCSLSVTAVQTWRKSRGLPANLPQSRLSPVVDAQRRELHAKGYTDAQIAGLTGVKRVTINAWRRERGLVANGRRRESVAS